MIYDRGDVVILPFPFITTDGIQRIYNIKQTEFIIEEGTDEFIRSGLAKTSVVRSEYLMTVPEGIISRKLGELSLKEMHKIDKILKLSLGL
jgi:hypothetical protein